MARLDKKGHRYEALVARMDKAKDEGYYIESMSIAYALMEERTYRILDHLSIQYNRSNKLYDCQNLLKDYVENNINSDPNNEILKAIKEDLIDSGLWQRIFDWRDDRNKMIHDLAKQTIDYNSLQPTCIEGCEIFRLFSALIMRIKKKLSKANNNS